MNQTAGVDFIDCFARAPKIFSCRYRSSPIHIQGTESSNITIGGRTFSSPNMLQEGSSVLCCPVYPNSVVSQ